MTSPVTVPETTPLRPRGHVVRTAALWLAIVVCAAGGLGQAAFLRPLPRQPVTSAPPEYGMPDYRPVQLVLDEGWRGRLTLQAWYIPGAHPETVVLCHGRGDSRAGLLPVARLIHDLGYSTLLTEFRAHGESDGTWSTVGAAEQRDLTAALDWLEANGSGPVAAFGYSMGGCVVLAVAARDARIRGVATEGAVADLPGLIRYWFGRRTTPFLWAARPWIRLRTGSDPWDARPVETIGQIAPRPILLIHSRADRVVPFRHGQQLAAAAGQPVEFWILEDVRHVGGVVQYPAEYRARLTAWLARTFEPTTS